MLPGIVSDVIVDDALNGPWITFNELLPPMASAAVRFGATVMVPVPL